MNVDVNPLIKVLVRKEFLYNFESGHGEFVEGYVFGATALKSRPILFHVHLESGAKFMRLPINAFCTKKDAPTLQTGDLQLWDCLSNNMVCHPYSYFKNYEVKVKLGKSNVQDGRYITTFDFRDEGGFEGTPDQHKDFNLIELEDGNFAIQPNNRILWIDEHFTGQPEGVPDYKAIQKYFLVDRDDFKDFGNDNSYFYRIDGEE
jgi:hypothetical protein